MRKKKYLFIAGADEAGRGAWAGPIAAAAVIFPFPFPRLPLRDSKQLTPRQREKLAPLIISSSLAWSLYLIPPSVIDQKGIAWANRQVIQEAINRLSPAPDYLLIDYLMGQPHFSLPHQFLKKGDQKSASIAAASILAKVARDKIMKQYDKIFPDYGFARHKGYGTALHRQKLKEKGLCPLHRRSYRPCQLILKDHNRPYSTDCNA